MAKTFISKVETETTIADSMNGKVKVFVTRSSSYAGLYQVKSVSYYKATPERARQLLSVFAQAYDRLMLT